MNVNSSTTTLTFTAPSLPDDVLTGTVVVMVTAISRYGVGQDSDHVMTTVTGMVTCIMFVYSIIVSMYGITYSNRTVSV